MSNNAASAASTNSDAGLLLFRDIFRRADKNDDQAVSFEEFKTYFRDGVLSSSDIQQLFNEIDSDGNKNIDCDELCNYFLKHWEPVREVFSQLEKMSASLSAALNNSAQSYQDAGIVHQFAIRFLFKEVVNQLESLQAPLISATNKMTEISVKQRPDVIPDSEQTDISGNIRGKKYQDAQTYSFSSGSSELTSQIDRLSHLVKSLETKFSIRNIEEDSYTPQDDKTILLVTREFHVLPDQVGRFKHELKTYNAETSIEDGFLHAHMRSLQNGSKFTLYELWENEAALENHYREKHSKAFQLHNIENLVYPESNSKTLLPSAWWSNE